MQSRRTSTPAFGGDLFVILFIVWIALAQPEHAEGRGIHHRSISRGWHLPGLLTGASRGSRLHDVFRVIAPREPE